MRPYLRWLQTNSTRVQVRRVGGQALKMEARITHTQRPDECSFVVAAPVPDDDHPPTQMLEEFSQELHDRFNRDVVLRIGQPVQPQPTQGRCHTQSGDDRDLVAVMTQEGSTGVFPFGAQVRRTSGFRKKPLSSIRTR